MGDEQEESEHLLTTTEVAKILHVHRGKISPLIRAGRLKAIDLRVGRQRPVYRIRPEDLDAFIENSRVVSWK